MDVPKPVSPYRILIIDDEADITKLLADALHDEGYLTFLASSCKEGEEAFYSHSPHAVLLDVWMHGDPDAGLILLRSFRKHDSLTPVIMMSGHSTITTALDALHHGAYDFIEKPFSTKRLLTTLLRALEQRRLKERLRVRESENAIPWIANSSSMRSIMALVDKISPTSSRVFIEGAAGSGKTRVSHEIHQRSLQWGPLVVIKGASLHDVSVLTEVWENTQGGTLVLDEVADINLDVQAFLISQLSIKHGSEFDLRIVATTRLQEGKAVQGGYLREDLYFRLNVIPIVLPPLQGRTEDIPLLLEAGLQHAQEILGIPKTPWHFDEEAQAAFQAYSWPGGVRQLLNMAERIIITWPQEDPYGTLGWEHVPMELKHPFLSLQKGSNTEHMLRFPLKQARNAFEREYLRGQLARFHYNIAKTAKAVGLERTALHRKLKLLEEDKEE